MTQRAWGRAGRENRRARASGEEHRGLTPSGGASSQAVTDRPSGSRKRITQGGSPGVLAVVAPRRAWRRALERIVRALTGTRAWPQAGEAPFPSEAMEVSFPSEAMEVSFPSEAMQVSFRSEAMQVSRHRATR